MLKTRSARNSPTISLAIFPGAMIKTSIFGTSVVDALAVKVHARHQHFGPLSCGISLRLLFQLLRAVGIA